MKILIADDHEVVRQGLRQILSDELSDITFGETANDAETLKRVWQENWDLVLLDINMPGRSGLETLVEIKKSRPQLPVLILTMFPETEYAVRALKSGAAGYLNKQSVGRELVEAVKKALGGGCYVTASLAQLLVKDYAKPSTALPHETLSNREFEVMKLLAVGRSVKEIAANLSLSEKTIFTYRTRLLSKLGLKSDVGIARYALQHRLVE